MPVKRRDVLLGTAAAGGLLLSPSLSARTADSEFADLPQLAARAVPIKPAEYAARIDKARRLMAEAGLDALLLEPGSSLRYFTGLVLYRSERFTGAIIPARGPIAYVTPAFEAPRLAESLRIGNDIRTWEEDADPFRRVAEIVRERSGGGAAIGLEGSVRYFVADGLAKVAPQMRIRSGEGVVRACRSRKSPAEIALMRLASDITMAAYRAVVPRLREGMTPVDFRSMMNAATERLGGRPAFSLGLFGAASAFPHGSRQPQQLREGDTVLMDCGCTVEGYNSDISRTIVFGTPSAEQRRVWEIEKEAQAAAFAAARLGVPCAAVDAAARAVIEAHGFGPGFRLPGLPHRTGHGIGLDGHEWPNFVPGATTPIAPGMCFSDEPGIYIYGKFGVRLEDCLWMAEDGPRWFSKPAPSLDDPLGAA
ncbi:MAG: M24 family metallopeptidase [Rhodothalassiaceae bacterium]